jgi:hypothetical protein
MSVKETKKKEKVSPKDKPPSVLPSEKEGQAAVVTQQAKEKKPQAPAGVVVQPTIEDVVKLFAEEFDLGEDEISSALKDYVDKGYSLAGAASRFRSDHRKNVKQRGANYEGRVIGIDSPRIQELGGGKASMVFSVAFLTVEAGVPTVRPSTFWGDERIKVGQVLQFDHCYRFNAVKSAQGALTRLDAIEEIEPTLPSVEDLPKLGVAFAELKDIEQYIDSSDIFKGVVGKLIKEQSTDEIIGFEVGDINGGPVTCWLGGKYRQAAEALRIAASTLREGDEVVVYGFISRPLDKDTRINCKGIFNLTYKREQAIASEGAEVGAGTTQ